MAARRVIGVAVLVLMAAAFASPGRIARDEGMCAPPAADTAKWKSMQVPGISMLVPPGFSQGYKDANNLAFGSGAKTIQIAKSEGPDQLATNGGVTILSTCSTDDRRAAGDHQCRAIHGIRSGAAADGQCGAEVHCIRALGHRQWAADGHGMDHSEQPLRPARAEGRFLHCQRGCERSSTVRRHNCPRLFPTVLSIAPPLRCR